MIAAALVLDWIVLRGASVRTEVAGEAPLVASVWIEGDRIRAIAPGDAAPASLPAEAANARVIDLAGQHLLPGLIDGWVGFDPEHDPLYLAAGVTTVRDMGGSMERVIAVRPRARRDAAPGPEINSCLVRVEGQGAAVGGSIQIANAQVATELLPKLWELQPDFVYVADNLTREVCSAVYREARGQKREVWGTLPKVLTPLEAMAAGQRGFVGLDWMLPPEVGWEIVQLPALGPRINELAQSKASLVPLLYGTYQRTLDAGDAPPELELLTPMYAAQWQAEQAMRRRLMQDGEFVSIGQSVVEKQGALLAELEKQGAHLLPGSGAPGPWLLPGRALHDELARWSAAGIGNERLLRAATAEAAAALGRSAEIGTLEVGKRADLIALRADPLADLAVLREPTLVVLRGKLLERAALDAGLERVRAQVRALRAADAQPLEIAQPKLPEGALVLSGSLEVRALSQRVSGERWAVVREPQGSLAYVGHIVLPGDGTVARSEMDVLQRTQDGVLQEFEVSLTTGGQTLVARGLVVAGRMSVERRMGARFLSNDYVAEQVAAIDVGSATTLLMLGQREREGMLRVIYFHEALAPELVAWRLSFREQGGHLAESRSGGHAFRIAPNGGISLWREQRGASVLEATRLETETHGGAGLPLSEAKLHFAPSSQPAEAAASRPSGGG